MISAPSDVPKLLVLSENGFVGSHLIGAGGSTGMHVLGFSRDSCIESGDRILRSLGTSLIPTVSGDPTEAAQIADVLERYRPDVVINAVDVVSPHPDPADWLGSHEVNYQTARATIDAIAGLTPGDRPFLLWIGTQDEYGAARGPWDESLQARPVSAYGTSKLLATTIVTSAIRAGRIDGCVVRLPVTFGPAQAPTAAVAQLIIAALEGRPLPTVMDDPAFMLSYGLDAAEWIIRLTSARGAIAVPPIINAPGHRPFTLQEVIAVLDGLVPEAVVGPPSSGWSPEQSSPWPDTTLAERIGLGAVLQTPLELAFSKTVAWYDKNRWFWDGR